MFFRVRANSAWGPASAWSPSFAVSTQIANPVITVASSSCSSVHLTWTQTGGGAASWDVYRSYNGSAPVLLTNTTTQSYDDYDIMPGAAYTYHIISYPTSGGYTKQSLTTPILKPCESLPCWVEVQS
jgi:hypothetical protein